MREGQARDRGCAQDGDGRCEADATGLTIATRLLLIAIGLGGADGHLSGVGEGITAPYCPSSPSPLVSVRCGANPQLVHSPLRSPLTCAAFRIHLIAIRFTLIPCQFVTARIPLAASPVLPVVPYLRIVGHVVSPRFRLPPTRSGPFRCCATGTGRAGDRSPATRARSPRPWGSSRGC